MVEPNLSDDSEDRGRTRVICGVVALRLSPAEREQIATAAGLQKMPALDLREVRRLAGLSGRCRDAEAASSRTASRRAGGSRARLGSG
jgi:hypothetical protein